MRRCIEVAHDAWKLLVHRSCLRTMMAQWFMMTKASKGKNLYEYSQEDEATQDIMFNDVKVLGCGHLNLGKYGYCGSCNKTLCWRCWQQCRDPVIRDLLLAKVCELTTTEWVNTCKVCSSTRPHDHCPYDCPGRIKYVTKIAMETLFAQTTFLPDKNVVFSCNCVTCVEKKEDYLEGRNIRPSFCRAERGFKVEGSNLCPTQFPDLHMCRRCFATSFYNIELMPLQLGWLNCRVLFRASRHHWNLVKNHKAAPPHHYIHTLEGGMSESMVEWACLHVGRHHFCHWDGHPCEMLSTSILCFEALRRIDANRRFQVICIPEECWHSGLCDFSSRKAMTQYTRLEEHLYRHKIRKADFEQWACRFREVVIDRRALRAGLLKELVFEWEPEAQLVQDLQQLCQDAAEFMHCDSLGILKAEHACRTIIAKAVELSNFVQSVVHQLVV